MLVILKVSIIIVLICLIDTLDTRQNLHLKTFNLKNNVLLYEFKK